MKIQLVDRNKEMCDQWRIYFKGCSDVVIHEGDFFDLPTDCVVSPANSFGFMDGGLDAAITHKLGRGVQNRIQTNLRNGMYPMGELLVGQAMLVPSDIAEIPWCISAPTMRVPMILRGTPNVYLAAKAIFVMLKDPIVKGGYANIETVTISGLGTGVGQVPYDVCAKQMRQAYDDVWLGNYKQLPTWYQTQKSHQELYTDTFRDLQFRKDEEI